MVKVIAKQIEEGGIGFAYQSAESSERIITGFAANGFEVANDMISGDYTSRYLGTVGGVAMFSPFVDETALEVARKSWRF